jgi:hypothetical protein
MYDSPLIISVILVYPPLHRRWCRGGEIMFTGSVARIAVAAAAAAAVAAAE